MKLSGYLTRESEDRFMLTEQLPVISLVNGTDQPRAYVRPGDAVGQRHFCKEGIFSLLGKKALQMRINETRKVTVEAHFND
jgi:hypothetical protein